MHATTTTTRPAFVQASDRNIIRKWYADQRRALNFVHAQAVARMGVVSGPERDALDLFVRDCGLQLTCLLDAEAEALAVSP
jgi:hypothetical protein